MQNSLLSASQLSRFCLRLKQARCARCIHTATRRWAEDDGNDDLGSTSDSRGKKKSAVAASDLLNALSDLRVQTTGDKQTSLNRRKKVSAAANFQRIVARAEQRRDGAEGEGEGEGEGEVEAKGIVAEEEKLPGLEEIQEMTMEAAKKVAEVYPERELVESDLLKELRRHDEATAAGERGEPEGIDSVLSGIRVQRQTSLEKRQEGRDVMSSKGGQQGIADQFDPNYSSDGSMRPEFDDNMDRRRMGRGEPYQRQRKRTLFDRQRLNIFSPATETDVSEVKEEGTSIWERELDKQLRELSYSTMHNGFEEAMKLTEEGKIWKYPIDNEQGMEKERKVAFHEHIFLDHLLEDFPRRAQVLDFMELVLIGLSKNPFLTVAQKHDHVAWFRDYFWQKEEIFLKLEKEEKVSVG
ncbi:28S ribosomal protein S31, mitochondrial [Strongylocentrotus purpuratus]|uniref:Small ribosomal subunit protein mS31 n=1 Tax=Strongylocentrotus purpuratus TaxID=7668 RepID=A0A7M7MYJ1_STRPU|nr:28S ribosomal protein S31, mitochondrial [Strongylocentrotus purpuratus]